MAPASPSSRPTPPSHAREFAERLFAAELGDASDDAALIAAAEHLSIRVPARLVSWFGAVGTLALVTRAIGAARATSPELLPPNGSVTPAEANPFAHRIAENAVTNTARVTADSAIAVIACLTELVARLIGDDLAANVLEQSASTFNVPSAASTLPATVKKS